METNKIEKVNYSKIKEALMELYMNCADNNIEMQGDILNIMELVKNEEKKAGEIKALAFELANKL